MILVLEARGSISCGSRPTGSASVLMSQLGASDAFICPRIEISAQGGFQNALTAKPATDA
jgi:hypothetical protein